MKGEFLYVDHSIHVQIRPLRDWNLQLPALQQDDVRVQIRPLRDWNRDASFNKSSLWQSSNQTVAGLKCLAAAYSWLLHVSFKSDRCGIEMQHIIHLSCKEWSSNQTVAGLKYIGGDSRAVGVCSVQIRPLRDWNFRCSIPLSSIFPVQIRPLRDWNKKLLSGYAQRNKVQIRPLRDWNLASSNTASNRFAVQIRPLRDWNCANI